MIAISPQNKDAIIVNARFLTRRITGLERYAIDLSHQLKQVRSSVRFVSPKNILHRSIADQLGVEVLGRLTEHLWEQMELPAYLRRIGGAKLLNLTNTGPIRYGNQITVIHDLAFLRNPRWFSRRAATWFTWLIPRVVRSSSAIVAQSEFTKRELMELLDVEGKKINVVYPGIPGFFFSRRTPGQKREDHRVVLAVSTLEPRKNHERLLSAFNLIEDKTARLIVVGGDNPLVFGRPRLREGNDAPERVKFTGYVSDAELAGLYQRADVFVSVSLYEGFGFPPLEALASGCKVLVSDIPSHREILGEAATYVNPLNTAEIAKALSALLASNEVDVHPKKEALLSRFSWSRAAEQLLAVIDCTSGN